MASIRVSTVIDAAPSTVWKAIEDVGSHVAWMEDAVAIRFLSPQRKGTGTRFECDTAVGPFSLTDVMEITEWRPRRSMGVRHVGVVTGSGRFTLRSARGGRTRFTWKERLVFPWWLGGPVGAAVGGEVLRLVWKRNLRNLRRVVEGR
ncbi:MAG: SRPBCC family protein [Acidimicrobiales bacterium]